MRIATWNVNSINARLEIALDWLRQADPDVVCLQEIKCVDEKFPREPIEALGYNVETHGQKSYNGVALLSKAPLEDVRRGLDGEDEDAHARYIEAVVAGPTPVRVASIYLPNGNPIGTEKFAYKLRWMARLKDRAAELLKLEEELALAGDFNVIPEPADAHNANDWLGDALYQPESRAAHRAIAWLGYTDAHLAAGEDAHSFTFWDYFRNNFERNRGIRIDHVFLSPQGADRLTSSEVCKWVRERERPSDHAPVMVTLDV